MSFSGLILCLNDSMNIQSSMNAPIFLFNYLTDNIHFLHYGSKRKTQGTTGFGLIVLLPRGFSGCPVFLTRSHMIYTYINTFT